MANIHVHKAFTLTHDDGTRQTFAVGSHAVPDHVAEHWYVKAHSEKPVPKAPPKQDAETGGKDSKATDQARAK